jgi:hypothetical protein
MSNGNGFLPADVWGKACNPACVCENSSNVHWCNDGGGSGCCTGGSVGGRGIMKMTAQQVYASNLLFWGVWNPKGLELWGEGFLREAGVRKGDIVTSINGLNMSKAATCDKACAWKFRRSAVKVKWLRPADKKTGKPAKEMSAMISVKAA